MAGYFGTEAQMRLQRRADELYHRARTTPGWCNTGRNVGIDDPDRIGWGALSEMVEREGAVGFRMLPAARLAEMTERFAARGCRVDTWDVFTARGEEALPPSRAILGKGLPDDLAMLDLPRDAGHEAVRSVQTFMAANGVMPFSGSMLVGEYGPAVTVAFIEGQGNMVAAAHCYFAHNEHSPYHRAAWAGLVVVAPSQRGRGLGTHVNACIVTAAFDRLGAESVHEFVGSGNQASRRMVEACGLRLDPSVKCAVASRQGERFTR